MLKILKHKNNKINIDSILGMAKVQQKEMGWIWCEPETKSRMSPTRYIAIINKTFVISFSTLTSCLTLINVK